ncbi:hypothetical protein EN829_066555, partial [Mesorhizobium sp. M00.F.Ca.ET.186.01.1.1]
MAECLRRETLGAAASPWAAMDDDSREEVRRRADHLIRLLSDYGVDLVRRGDVEPPSAPTSQTILANQVYAQPD